VKYKFVSTETKTNPVLPAKGPGISSRMAALTGSVFEVQRKREKVVIFCRPVATVREKTTPTRRRSKSREIF
jgi:hypothetical protein